MRSIFLLLILLLSINLFGEHTQEYLKNASSYSTSWGFDALSNYRLKFASEDELSKFENDPMNHPAIKFYITTMDTACHYLIIDSIESRLIGVGDTNVLIIEKVDDTAAHLITLFLSPKLEHDTLITINLDNPNNWISKTWLFRGCSIKDSIVFYEILDKDSAKSNCAIIKIQADNKWQVAQQFNFPIRSCITKDFRQILICTPFQVTEEPYEQGRLYIYDIPLDSFYLVNELKNGVKSAERLFRDSSIYCHRRQNDELNVWELRPDGSNINLTNITYPKYVNMYYIITYDKFDWHCIESYYDHGNVIQYDIKSWTDWNYFDRKRVFLKDYLIVE